MSGAQQPHRPLVTVTQLVTATHRFALAPLTRPARFGFAPTRIAPPTIVAVSRRDGSVIGNHGVSEKDHQGGGA